MKLSKTHGTDYKQEKSNSWSWNSNAMKISTQNFWMHFNFGWWWRPATGKSQQLRTNRLTVSVNLLGPGYVHTIADRLSELPENHIGQAFCSHLIQLVPAWFLCRLRPGTLRFQKWTFVPCRTAFWNASLLISTGCSVDRPGFGTESRWFFCQTKTNIEISSISIQYSENSSTPDRTGWFEFP